MIKVNCSELSGKTKLALAEAISETLDGTGIALLDGNCIAIDILSGPDIGADQLQDILRSSISGLKDASAYRVEIDSKRIAVRSSVPASSDEKRVEEGLPPGLFKCTVCGFVTTSDQGYHDHLRIHDLIRGL